MKKSVQIDCFDKVINTLSISNFVILNKPKFCAYMHRHIILEYNI